MTPAEKRILNEVCAFYAKKKHPFEGLASYVATRIVGHGCKRGWVTKRSGDMGIDFVCRLGRWEACRTIAERRPDKDFRIPATIFTGSDFQAEQLVIESNRQRVKTPEQKAREFRELKRIEAALAKERQLAAQNNRAARAVQARLPEQARGQARDKAAEAVGMGGRTAEKLLALVQKADGGDPQARAALDAVNEGRMSVDAAYRMAAAPKPERDAASIGKDERTARDLNWLCKAHALDAEVFRSKDEGRFRLTANNLTETQVSELLECLESFRGPTRTDTAPRPLSFFSQATG